MGKLTEEQMQEANRVWCEFVYDGKVIPLTDKVRKIFETVAPYLQLPMDDPTEDEYASNFKGNYHDVGDIEIRYRKQLLKFVRRRNDAIQPKPVDPRRLKILLAIRKRSWPLDIQQELMLVDNIVAALDEVK